MLDLFSIRELADDEIISEPGFYRLPIERHHGQPCSGPSVTSSILRTMDLAGPAAVWAFHVLNPNRYERKETRALVMGQAMASYVEGGQEELARRFWVLPADKPNRPTAQQMKAIEEGRGTEAGIRSLTFWSQVDRDPRAILTQDEWDLIRAMGAVLRADPAAQVALGGEPEITMAWYDERSRLWCLSRPDQLSMSGMMVDFKKVNTSGAPFTADLVDRKITSYAYGMQMAFAAEGFEAITGCWPSTVGLVFQVDEPPYSVILRGIEEEDLRMDMWRNQRAMRRFRECLDAGYWPGPGDVIGSYKRPAWQREAIIARMAAEGASI